MFPRSRGLGAALSKVLGENQEHKDQVLAERATRIMQSEVWQKDFFPLIVSLHDAWLEKVKAGTAHIDALKSLDDLVNMIDGAVQVGAGALKRISERRFKAAQIQAKIKEEQALNLSLRDSQEK